MEIGNVIGIPFVKRAGTGVPVPPPIPDVVKDDSAQWLFGLGCRAGQSGSCESEPDPVQQDLVWEAIDKRGFQTRQIQQGRCYDFNGTDTSIDSGSSPAGNFTVGFGKLVLGTDAAFVTLYYAASQIWVHYFYNGASAIIRLFVGTLSGYFETTLSRPLNGHEQLVCTWNGTTAVVYVDGVSQSGSVIGTLNNPNAQVSSSIAYRTSIEYTNGKMGDFRLFDHVITAQEITDWSNGIIIGDEYIHYKFDEQVGTKCFDSSGNTRDGAINGTLTSFHATDNEYWSFQNQFGYNLKTINGFPNTFVPTDNTDDTVDVEGTPLTQIGRVRYNAALVDSNLASFNGTDNYIDRGDVSNMGTGDYSIYIRGTFVNQVGTLISKGDGFSQNGTYYIGIFNFGTTGGITIWLRDDTGTQVLSGFNTGENGVADGNEHEIFIVFDRDQYCKVFVDWTEDATTAINNTNDISSVHSLNVGSYGDGAGDFLSGDISETRVWNAVKTENEVKAYDETNLVEQYNLAEGSDDIIYNKVDGTEGTIGGTLTNFWDVAQVKPDNLLDGFDLWTLDGSSPTEYLRVPFDNTRASIKTDGDSITNYTWVSKNIANKGQNRAETAIVNYLNPEMIRADENDGLDFLYNAGKTAPNKILYDDFEQIVEVGDERDHIFTNTSDALEYRDHIVFGIDLTAQEIIDVKDFIDYT